MARWARVSDVLWHPVAACGNLWRRAVSPYNREFEDLRIPNGRLSGFMQSLRLQAAGWRLASL